MPMTLFRTQTIERIPPGKDVIIEVNDPKNLGRVVRRTTYVSTTLGAVQRKTKGPDKIIAPKNKKTIQLGCGEKLVIQPITKISSRELPQWDLDVD